MRKEGVDWLFGEEYEVVDRLRARRLLNQFEAGPRPALPAEEDLSAVGSVKEMSSTQRSAESTRSKLKGFFKKM